jgi:hypothetical protein
MENPSKQFSYICACALQANLFSLVHYSHLKKIGVLDSNIAELVRIICLYCLV